MNKLVQTPVDRRNFMRLLGSVTAFGALPGWLRAASDEWMTVSVLHTTDLHGHILPTATYEGIADVGGLARCATQIAKWKRLNPHHLLIDAGDVYQGTQVGLLTRGQVMIKAFNHLNYDAWIIGNHEFDWGMDAVNEALTVSTMPALSANSLLEGRPAGELDDPRHPLSRVQPYILKEVAGFKIGVVGVTTTGMPYWFHEDLYRGFTFVDPVEPVRRALQALRAQGADVVILAGHMGLRRGGDDFANRTQTLMAEFPEAVAFIGGHTHQHVPNDRVHGMLYTQASYFGIHAGRLDLVLNRSTRQCLWVQPMTSWMDDRFAVDPGILSLAADDLEEADRIMATPVGTLAEPLSIDGDIGRPSQVEELIGAAFIEGMAARGVELDAVIHGLIFPEGDVPAGEKTIADMWRIMPYENKVVTARLNREEIITILYEVYTDWSKRSIMGMAVDVEGRGRNIEIHEVYDRHGRPLHRRNRYTVAFNSYDAQSGGKRHLHLRDILRQPTSQTRLHAVQTRDLLVDYFAARNVVEPVTSLTRA